MLFEKSLASFNKENIFNIFKKRPNLFNIIIDTEDLERHINHINDTKIYKKNNFEENKNCNELIKNNSFCDIDKIININEVKEIQIKDSKNRLGRKKKRNGIEGKHNKFSDDNIRRKCKHIVLYNAMDFINIKISESYNGNIGQGIFLKKLLMLNHEQKSNSNVKYNQDFLEKKLGEIFSENISTRYTSFPADHNKNLINNLINEKDDNKRNYFTNLFNITFIECLKHFRGSETIDELNGLKGYNEAINEFAKDNENYKECLKYYINNFENIINNKKSRIRTKKDKIKNKE